MLRNLVLAALMLLLTASSAPAQDWAEKMFAVTSHDFGVVARGAKAEFAFEFQNKYKEDIHIAGVRTSCGCTTPKVTQQTLKSLEKAQVIAVYNTHSFLGKKSATITVVIDQPYYAEVRLEVTGFIRSDVVLQPGVVDFGQVDHGHAGEQKVQVNYAGRPDWRIKDVRCANSNFEVVLNEASRSGGRVNYEMIVRLKKDAPAGYFQDELILVTDDDRLQTIPLAVQGNVVSALTVSPASLFLGVLEPGQEVTKQLVVRGKQPFKIVSVKCKDGCFTFKPSEEAKTLHFVPVTFKAGDEPAKVTETIEIETDLAGGNCASCLATATIKSAG